MKKLTMTSVAIAMLSGCYIYPTYYQPAPRYYYYVPGAGPSVPVAPQSPSPSSPAPQAPAPAFQQPTPPAWVPQAPVTSDAKLRELQRNLDEAQKALDDYTALYNQERVAEQRAREAQAAREAHAALAAQRSLAAPPPPVDWPMPGTSIEGRRYGAPATAPARVATPMRPEATTRATAAMPPSSFGFTLGARSLSEPIDDVSVLPSIGLALTHRLADSSLMLDLGVAASGFTESGGVSERTFGTIEGSAGLRLTGASSDRNVDSRPRRRDSWYVGAGVVALEVIDTIENTITSTTVDESTDSATGTYLCAGIRFEDGSTSCGDLELRQISGTSYTTFGQERSSDGVEVLLRLAFAF